MTIASDDVSSGALLQTRFFRCISLDAFLQMHSSRRSKLQIKFLCSWTCSIRIFMNSTLIMDHVHLNKLFSISNWWFLIPCYYQNSRGDFEKHPLFQQILVMTLLLIMTCWLYGCKYMMIQMVNMVKILYDGEKLYNIELVTCALSRLYLKVHAFIVMLSLLWRMYLLVFITLLWWRT